MPGSTYTQLLFHVVFSTRHREPSINDSIAERLHAYLGGIVRAEDGVLLACGGMPDHVHLYIRSKADGSLSDLLRVVKSRSSRWVHETFPDRAAFKWQEGYSAFSVSRSQGDIVTRYIENQAEHHRRLGFKSELLRLLEAHGIEFDERYVFD